MIGRARGTDWRYGLAGLTLLLGGCHGGGAERPVVVDIMGEVSQLAEPLRNDRTLAAQSVLGATGQGLVAFDTQGEVVAALAESWIVADGGQSYIFRLRRANWANGDPVKAEEVANLLQERMRACPDMLAGLAPEVRAMTDRVIEIRLETSLPAFIQLLAQPRLAILGKAGGTGPYVGDLKLDRLYLRPLQEKVEQDDKESPPEVRPMERRTLETGRPSLAIARFQAGKTDLVLGGRFQHLLLIPAARLGSSDVRADPAPGLFGLAVVGSSPFLADPAVRKALAQIVDRAELAKALNLQGWTTATQPLPAQLDLPGPPSQPDWADASMDQRRKAAKAAVNAWRAAHGALPRLRIALPSGAGATLLYYRLAADFRQLGIRIDRVTPDRGADLRLIDSVAAFDSALWYLAQLDCTAGVVCDSDASSFLDAARTAETPVEQSTMLAEAERLIVANNGYIPLGLPIRWSLVNSRLTSYTPSPRAVHPLNQLIRTTK